MSIRDTENGGANRICDICEELIDESLVRYFSDHELLVYGNGGIKIVEFDFCEDCELLLTEAIINGKMKTHLRGI